MIIAAIDPGTNLGVCKAPKCDRSAIRPDVTLKTVKLRDTTDIGAWLRSSDDHIREVLRGADLLAIEKPNTQGQNHTGLFKNIALYAHCCYWACHHGVRVQPINASHVKTILTDRGNAVKDEMVAAAEFQLGLKPGEIDHNAADAFAVWLVASFGIPKSASQRAQEAATARRIAREQARAEKAAADAAKKLPLF